MILDLGGGSIKGECMKKLFVVICNVLIISSAWAKYKVGTGCLVNTSGNDHFYFCGSARSSCAGVSVWKKNRKYQYYHGDGFVFEGNKAHYFFCAPDPATTGWLVTAKEWQTGTIVTETFPGGGTCKWVKYKNVCDEEWGEKCTVPDNCPEGKLARNGECATLCDAGYGFRGKASNDCIECATGLYKGTDEDGVCIQCDEMTEFYDSDTRTCIKKSSMTRWSRESMAKCYACPGDIEVLCTTLFNTDAASRHAHAQWADVKKRCLLKDSD